jgi:S-adenosylmethionine hydrolase
VIVTLTTDFGRTDGYVAAMKGVLYTLAPRLTVVDLTHEVPAFDVSHAAYVLHQAAPFFPSDTVHVAVIDPGVGGPRRGMVVVQHRQYFVGPDNGVFTPFLTDEAVVHELVNPALWLPNPAAVFHGRDLFAPTAARLVTGLAPADCGPRLADPVRLPAWQVRREGEAVIGAIVHVDHFGNCISSISADRLKELGEGPCHVEAANGMRVALRRTYSEASPGEVLALVGSTGLIEIAVREGSAAAQCGVKRGDAVRVLVTA